MSAAARLSPRVVRTVLAAAVGVPLSLAAVAGAQTTQPTGPSMPAPATAPALTIEPLSRIAPPTTAPAGGTAAAPAAAELAPVTQPFVAQVTGDKVYVRSGPGTSYYELGQLSKGDLVYVVGTKSGWYQILPPNGTFCLIAKEFVEVDAAGGAAPSSGTVKGDYINVRAGTAINRSRDPFAVLAVVRKGTQLRILGATDKYYEIAPPERAFVYVSPQFVTKSTAEYKIPDLKLPAGATAPAQTTVTTTTPPSLASATPPAAGTGGDHGAAPGVITPPAVTDGSGGERPRTSILPPAGGTGAPTIGTIEPPASMPAVGQGTTTQPADHAAQAPVPAPVPAVTFSQTATQKFNELNTRYQEEGRKPLVQQNVDDLLKEYRDLLAMENISPSVKIGTESRITALEKVAAIQRLTRENAAADDSLAKQRQALQEQYSSAERAIADYQRTSAFIAEGKLQTSTIVQGKYALVNPQTGRVVAYVDPASDINIGALVGQYIGVRGTTSRPAGSDITLIKVTNATLMAPPGTGGSGAGGADGRTGEK